MSKYGIGMILMICGAMLVEAAFPLAVAVLVSAALVVRFGRRTDYD